MRYDHGINIESLEELTQLYYMTKTIFWPAIKAGKKGITTLQFFFP